MEDKYVQATLNYEKMNEGVEYAEGDKYIKQGMENCSKKPINVIRFNYATPEQQKRIYQAISECLISYGATSPRSIRGESYIMPYFKNEEGKATSTNTRNRWWSRNTR